MDEMILLMGHGSRDPDGVREFLDLVAAVRDAATLERTIEAGVLEFSRPGVPSIQAAIDRCVALGAHRVLAVPVLLFNAGHAKEDMPEQVTYARARHPGLDLRLAQPLGLHRSLLEIVEERLGELEHQLSMARPEETAVLLVGRGTSDAAANGDLFKLGRLLWERNRYGMVECCFSGMTQPLVPAGIDRCVRLGVRRVLVIPYFLNTGVLVKRIHSQVRAAQEAYPDVEITTGGHLGVHPKLVQVILAQAAALATKPPEPDGLVERTWRSAHAEVPHQHGQHDHAPHDLLNFVGNHDRRDETIPTDRDE